MDEKEKIAVLWDRSDKVEDALTQLTLGQQDLRDTLTGLPAEIGIQIRKECITRTEFKAVKWFVGAVTACFSFAAYFFGFGK